MQDNLRVAMNAFSEMLAVDTTMAYQLGFQYLRQLLLHLRNVRANSATEAAK